MNTEMLQWVQKGDLIGMGGIFVSCVSKEFHGDTSPGAASWLGSYRAQLALFLQTCGQHVVYQETFAQGEGDLLAKLEDYIAKECKAVIHLIGHDAGWSPDDDLPEGPFVSSDAVHALLNRYGDAFLAGRPSLRQRLVERGFRGISATQWEAYLAIHHNKPLLVFTFADQAQRAPTFRPQTALRNDRLSQTEHLELLRLTGFDRTEQLTNQHEFKEAAIASLVRTGVLSVTETAPPTWLSEFSSNISPFISRFAEALHSSHRQAGSRAADVVASKPKPRRKKLLLYCSLSIVLGVVVPFSLVRQFGLKRPPEVPSSAINALGSSFKTDLLKIPGSSSWIASTEVTQSLFDQILPKSDGPPRAFNIRKNKEEDFTKIAGEAPAIWVSENDVADLLKSLNEQLPEHGVPHGYEFRIPTLQELQAVADPCELEPIHGDVTDLRERAIYRDTAEKTNNSALRATLVKSKKKNNLGLYDLVGNAYELVRKDLDDGSLYVVGGSFDSEAKECCLRDLKRFRGAHNSVGFRLILAPVKQK